MLNLKDNIDLLKKIVENAENFHRVLSSYPSLSFLTEKEYDFDAMGIFARFTQEDTAIEINISDSYELFIIKNKEIKLKFSLPETCLDALSFILPNLKNEDLYDTQQNIERYMLLRKSYEEVRNS